jgi:hypothetical protein
VLSTVEELPAAPRKLVRILLLLIQTFYLACYVAALANLREIDDIFLETKLLSPSVLTIVLLTTAAVLIPVRMFSSQVLHSTFDNFPQSSPECFRYFWASICCGRFPLSS